MYTAAPLITLFVTAAIAFVTSSMLAQSELHPDDQTATHARSRLIQTDDKKLFFRNEKQLSETEAKEKQEDWKKTYPKMWDETTALINVINSITSVSLSTAEKEKFGDLLTEKTDNRDERLQQLAKAASGTREDKVRPDEFVQAIAQKGLWKRRLTHGNVQVTRWDMKNGGITPAEADDLLYRVYNDANSFVPQPRFIAGSLESTKGFKWIGYKQKLGWCTLDTLVGPGGGAPFLCTYRPGGGLCGGAHGIDAAVYVLNKKNLVSHILFISVYSGSAQEIAKSNNALKAAAERVRHEIAPQPEGTSP